VLSRPSFDGRDVRLSPKVFETLVLLVERHGLLVDKDDLMILRASVTSSTNVSGHIAGEFVGLRNTFRQMLILFRIRQLAAK
jgi:hypothetical protein